MGADPQQWKWGWLGELATLMKQTVMDLHLIAKYLLG